MQQQVGTLLRDLVIELRRNTEYVVFPKVKGFTLYEQRTGTLHDKEKLGVVMIVQDVAPTIAVIKEANVHNAVDMRIVQLC